MCLISCQIGAPPAHHACSPRSSSRSTVLTSILLRTITNTAAHFLPKFVVLCNRLSSTVCAHMDTLRMLGIWYSLHTAKLYFSTQIPLFFCLLSFSFINNLYHRSYIGAPPCPLSLSLCRTKLQQSNRTLMLRMRASRIVN